MRELIFRFYYLRSLFNAYQVMFFTTKTINVDLPCCLRVYIQRPKFLESKEPSAEQMEQAKEKITVLETLIGDKQFITGDTLTLADISVAAGFPLVKHLEPSLFSPKLEKYLQRVFQACPELKQLEDSAIPPPSEK